MALLDFASFNTGATRDAGSFVSADGKWAGLLAHTTDAGYSGGYGIRTNGIGETYSFLANKQTVIVGMRYRAVTGIDDAILRFIENLNYQVTIGTTASGAIRAWRGSEAGTVIGTSVATGIIATGTWYFIEAKVTISDTVGVIEVRVDGVTVLTLSGIDTKNSSAAYTTGVVITGQNGVNTADFNSFYYCDDSGTLNNSFLGVGEALLRLVNGAGSLAQWTPSAGSNYQNVDDSGSTHDSDTTYNETSTAGNEDEFAVADIPVTGGSVAGVKQTTVMRKTDGGVRQAAPVINLGGGRSQRSTKTLTTPYVFYQEVFETDPVDASTLTEAKVNAVKIGYNLIA